MITTPTEKTLVNYTVTDGIAVIELINPPANTYSYEMMSQLDAAIVQARFDEQVHVLVIRGAGEKFFSAGADIEMLNSVTPTYKYYCAQRAHSRRRTGDRAGLRYPHRAPQCRQDRSTRD
jgi:enoyl-CoA hydratase